MRFLVIPLGLLLLTLAACGGDVEGGGGSGGSGGAQGQGGSGGAQGQGGSGGAIGVACGGADPAFPDFDKTCAAASDCVVKLHMIDCCGTMIAIGVSQADSAAFDAAEAACDAMYPGCGCAAQPTVAEDGQTALDPATLHVDCINGACSTYVQ